MSVEARSAGDEAIDAVKANPRDEEAWRQFYQCFRPRVAALVYRLGVRDPADVTQEVFYRFLRNSPWHTDWSTLPPGNVVMAYLARIARNIVWSGWRAATNRPREESEDNFDGIEGPLSLDTDAIFARLFADLSESDSDLLRALVDGSSLAEIAASGGISYQAAGVRVHRLKKKIKVLLGRYGETT